MEGQNKALLINYDYCTGCQTCMMACQVEKHLPIGRYGIFVNTVGPWEIDGETNTWQYDYVPVLTDECDLCAERTAKGKPPTCVAHCLAAVMEYGTVEELARKMDGSSGKQMLHLPKSQG